MIMEIWKDIEGYEGLYKVSNEGRVRSVRRNIILKPFIQRGYATVVFSVGNKRKTIRVHRLVAEAFIPNTQNKPEIDHMNCIRNDNRVENLRWVTHQENMFNPITRKNSFGHITHRRTVFQYTLENELVNTYNSALEAAKENGWRQCAISKCCNGGFFCKSRNKWVECETYKGYRWSYVPL